MIVLVDVLLFCFVFSKTFRWPKRQRTIIDSGRFKDRSNCQHFALWLMREKPKEQFFYKSRFRQQQKLHTHTQTEIKKECSLVAGCGRLEMIIRERKENCHLFPKYNFRVFHSGAIKTAVVQHSSSGREAGSRTRYDSFSSSSIILFS